MTEVEFEHRILPCHVKMYKVAVMITGNSEDASDIVQDAFSRLWERRDEIPNPMNPEGYCITVVRRMAIDSLRRRQRYEKSDDGTPTIVDISTETKIESGDSLQRVQHLMNQLPPNQREVIHLSSFGGLDNREIAGVTGLSDVNVRALLSRGRRMLKKLFESEN